MKILTNRRRIIVIALCYFIPTVLGILGSFLNWKIAYRLIQFGIYAQGVIVISFVIYLLYLFLHRIGRDQ